MDLRPAQTLSVLDARPDASNSPTSFARHPGQRAELFTPFVCHETITKDDVLTASSYRVHFLSGWFFDLIPASFVL